MKKYKNLEVEIKLLKVKDIICTSGWEVDQDEDELPPVDPFE